MSRNRTAVAPVVVAPVADLALVEAQAPIEQPEFVEAYLNLADEVAALPAPVAPARGRKSAFGEGMTIEVLVAANPKKVVGKSRLRFDLYRNGMTVGEYLDACVALEGPRAWARHRYLADLHWDTERNFIAVWPAK